MKIRKLDIDDLLEITTVRREDERGFFSETWNRRTLAEVGVDVEFVQDNHSLSVAAGTVRGLHFQTPPFAQAKLVRVLSGKILDIAVDIRLGSPTFGRWVGVELSAEKWNQLFIPIGFAHGFVTLLPNTEIAYKVSNYYSPEHDRTILFDDPALAIQWPLELAPFQLSIKDREGQPLSKVDAGFIYQG